MLHSTQMGSRSSTPRRKVMRCALVLYALVLSQCVRCASLAWVGQREPGPSWMVGQPATEQMRLGITCEQRQPPGQQR